MWRLSLDDDKLFTVHVELSGSDLGDKLRGICAALGPDGGFDNRGGCGGGGRDTDNDNEEDVHAHRGPRRG